MAAHSTVTYVEPNLNIGMFHATNEDIDNGYSNDIWRVDDEFDRAPRLEDYCIALNLEVEVSSRDAQGTRDVIILQWGGDNGGVSFMAGTKIGGYDISGTTRSPKISPSSRDYLTTYYADMYVGDLIDYGTTEMVGIKSVNVEYQKSCVPQITIKFTDVRGLSLFQPTELSRNNSYDGIKGLNRDNIAQSFFQCFFKMPLPKFTIFIKGFYGKPVSYVMMCDKFETNFDAESGSFDIDTHFVGYSYSFMTDISFDAMLAAPYSDFEGQAYWEQQVRRGRFVLEDKYGNKRPMPTLYEIHEEFKKLIKDTPKEMVESTLTSEELTHEEEIAKLRILENRYETWYKELLITLNKKYGKRYCFEFKKNNNWLMILVLATHDSTNPKNLAEAYTQFPSSFKEVNDDLYALIEDFNSSGNSYKKIKSISKDFSDYTRISLFNDCYVNHNTRKIEFGGFSNKCNLNKTQVVNRMFYGENSSMERSLEGASEEERKRYNDELDKYKKDLKDFTLSTIYSDGTHQYIDAYLIEVDYSGISTRIKMLTQDANKDAKRKERAKRRKEHNKLMMSKMNWYPSVENFMKVVMAHVETYMAMMYRVKNECANRTPKEMNVTVGSGGDACDVNENAAHLTPFPRIVKNEVGDDNITRTVDGWVGDFTDGGKRFIEEELINGLFNGISTLMEKYETLNAYLASSSSTSSVEDTYTPYVKHPLTSFDFFLTKYPYANDNNIANNVNTFAGCVAIRMFEILSLSNFKREYGKDSFSYANTDMLKKLGEIEADNFDYCVKITNKNILKMLGADGGEGTITPSSIIDCVKNGVSIDTNNDIPWKKANDKKDKNNLFDNEMWLERYHVTNRECILYPKQAISFVSMNECLTKFMKGGNDVTSMDFDNNDIMVSYVSALPQNVDRLISSKSNADVYGDVYIRDKYKIVSSMLDSSCSSPSNSYSEVYKIIYDNSVFNSDIYKKFIYASGVFRPCLDINTSNLCPPYRIESDKESLGLKINKTSNTLVNNRDESGEWVYYEFDSNKLDMYVSEAENNNVTSWFFTECRGFVDENNNRDNPRYVLSKNSTLFSMADYQTHVDCIKSLYDRTKGYNGLIFILMGFEAIDYSEVVNELASNKTFVYIPKLAVLQMGAVLSLFTDKISSNVSEDEIRKYIPIPATFEKIINYLNRISYAAKIAYVKYFKNWANGYDGEIRKHIWPKETSSKLINGVTTVTSWGYDNLCATYEIGEDKKTRRMLYREDSAFSKGLATELMSIVLVAKGNMGHFRASNGKNYKAGYRFNADNAKAFLEGFLTRLKAIYGIKTERGTEPVKLTRDPNKVTDDMKKELYRYMKLVYDKWIPSMEKEEWEFETFFDKKEEEKIKNNGSAGHLFHFIDSFYNKIGNKLLINPSSLSEIIDKALVEQNANTMMLGFVADVLSKNRCMLLSLQNFQDLSDPKAMEMMMRPVPYLSMNEVNRHPDFVIVYPYEPSKYLNVDNGEFVNDSFMLNDEYDTPMAIRSRTMNEDDYYRIPAFGVSYGKQYQSYFKKVNVGMKSPIATQQSIMAKHAVLRASVNGKEQTTAANDLYDIYTTQSYTCTVEMLGCAWVQPLMYFVLTNIPMFRGSYLIFKVTHSITPGNMVTTFQGTRMANVSNKIVDEIFTDDFEDEFGDDAYIEDTRSNQLANVDNNCPYKVYPLFEDANIGKNEYERAYHAMVTLTSLGFTEVAAAGICGNIFKESTWNEYATNGKTFGLCQWRGIRQENLKKKYRERPSFDEQLEFIREEWNKDSPYKDDAAKHFDKLQNAKTPEDAAMIVRKQYERCGDSEADDTTRKTRAMAYYKKYQENQNPSITDLKPKNRDIRDALFNAVKKSLESTNRTANISKRNVNAAGFTIYGSDKNDNQLDLVFDILLNGYYEYIQQLEWYTDELGGTFVNKPSKLVVIASEKPRIQDRRILIYDRNGKLPYFENIDGQNNEVVNKSLLMSLIKRYTLQGLNTKETEQFKNTNLFNGISLNECDELMSSNIIQNPAKSIPNNARIMIDGWDVEKVIEWAMNHAAKCKEGEYCGHGKCAAYVENAIAGCNGAGKKPTTGISRRPSTSEVYKKRKGNVYATNLRYDHILDMPSLGFDMIYSGECTPESRECSYTSLQAGDVAIIGFDARVETSSKYHACIWSGSQWISDYTQGKKMSPYRDKSKYPKGYLPYAIYRYHSKSEAKPKS